MLSEKIKLFIVTLFIAPLFLNAYAATNPYSNSLKHHPRPRKGCYPISKISVTEAKELLASQNLSVKGATNKETKVLGAVIYWAQYLNDGVLRTGRYNGKKRCPFIINDTNGAGQRSDHIKIGRSGSKKFGESAAQYAHEWGHLVGNNGTYAKFKNYMKGFGYCKVSGYSDNKDNEQFAEVFAAFITEPKILKNNSVTPKACRQAYKFFHDWFDAGNRNVDCQH